MKKIAVYGLGKIGLPLAAAFLKAGHSVIGVNRTKSVADELNRGIVRLEEPGVEEIIRSAVSNKKFLATTDPVSAAKESNVMIIIIPIILDDEKNADIAPLVDLCKQISKGLKRGDLVVTETTLPPGTTQDVVAKELEVSGLKAGEDFFVAHAPERVYSGRILEDFENYPKIVGGIDVKSAEMAKDFYEKISPKGVILMKNATAAELVKIFGIVYRNVNIALANELAQITRKLGLDYNEIREATNSQPFSHLLKPGIPGGHCVPVYPHFISNQKEAELIRTALELNENGMVNYVIGLVESELKSSGKKMRGANVCVLGLSYRCGVKESRYSAGTLIGNALKELGATVTVFDSMYTKKEVEETGFTGADSMAKALEGCDIVVIANDCAEFKNINTDVTVIDYMGW